MAKKYEKKEEKHETFIRSGTIKRRGPITRPLATRSSVGSLSARDSSSIFSASPFVSSRIRRIERIEKERATRCGPHATTKSEIDDAAQQILARKRGEQRERERVLCGFTFGATSRMSTSNGCGMLSGCFESTFVIRLSGNKRRPEATGKMRFHKFFKTCFIHGKFRRWIRVAMEY